MSFYNCRRVFNLFRLLFQCHVKEVLCRYLHEYSFFPEQVLQLVVRENVTCHQPHWHVSALGTWYLPLLQINQVGQSLFFQNTKLFVKLLVRNSHMVAFFPHLNGIQNAQVLDLIVRHSVHKHKCLFLFVWFYASNKMKTAVGWHLTDKFLDFFSNLDPQILFVWFSFHCFEFFFKDTFDYKCFRLGKFENNIFS